jgi:amino acid adenylation domain-containing protein/non-ribosomal peptide synthase protein (TIGR01720 family)
MSNADMSTLSPEQKRQLLAKLLKQQASQQLFPLSFAQKRLWFLEQLQPGLSVYNLSAALRLTGKLSVAALEHGFQSIIRRHEILRTSFLVVDGEPKQNVISSNQIKFVLPVVNLQGLSAENQTVQVMKLATALTTYPFDLQRAPLLRAVLLQLGTEESVLVFVMHHIIADYWSLRVLVQELTLFYSDVKTTVLPSLNIQYGDFATWQQKWLKSEARIQQLTYWQQQLQDYPRELSLPTDYPRPAVLTWRGDRKFFALSAELSQKLGQLAQQQGATLFTVLLAAFKVLLYRYSGQKDILVGSTVTSRDRAEIANLIGLFVNNLIFRTKISDSSSFYDLLSQVKETVFEALAHQELPFEDLVEQLQPERNLSQNPLFQVMFVLHNTPNQSVQIPGLTIEPLETEHSATRFDLSLDMYETPNALTGTFEYSVDLFEAATIERLIEHFQTLLLSVVEHPQQLITELPLLTQTEQQLFTQWNNTAAEIPNLCVHELFVQQAEKTPDKTAIIFENDYLTYEQVNKLSNQLANYLIELGIQPETRIGICCDRSPEMIIALLGVLKAGGAYVPLDPAYPQERLEFILEDAQISILLTQSKILNLLPNNIQCICIDTMHNVETLHVTSLQQHHIIDSNQIAYLIYTSGSTGTPKGVQILHRGLTNFLISMAQAPGITNNDKLLAVTTLAFDIAALEIFLPLIVGATLVLAPREVTIDGVLLANTIAQHQITIMQATPATWRLLFATGWNGKTDLKVLCGGEALDNGLAQQLLATSTQVWNLYGPTETTIWSAAKKLEVNQPVTIGHPIANTQFYVLDEHLQQVPVGVPGELYIGGFGVARGYWQRPDLTAEKFIPTPNSSLLTPNFIYKTGDRVRYLPNGDLEYLGRLDNQVKIRGFRIELGEIESLLQQHPEIAQAVVIVREDEPGEKRLVAYVQLGTTLPSDYKAFLATKLPAYMIPTAFVVLEEFPLTPNGKINRKALPAPDTSSLNINEKLTLTPTEELLANIWAPILAVESISAEDNFFELGGHSLLATRVISKIRQVFSIDLPLRYLFETPKLCDLAQVIVRMQQGQITSTAIVPIERTENLPLSFAQQRFWILTQLEPNSSSYNIPLAVQIQGNINLEILQRSFQEIVQRQEILRTGFYGQDGQASLKIADNITVNIPVIDLQALTKPQQQIEELARSLAQQPFNLEEIPLLRVQLIRVENTNCILLLQLHHIIADAWSMGLLIRDTAAIYQRLIKKEAPLPKLPIQYVDFAHWQRQHLPLELTQHLEYWRQQLADAPALLELPTDYPRPAVQSFKGAIYRFDLSAELTQKLKQLSRANNSTLFMTLLAAWNVLLHRYTNSDDIVVGSPIANRQNTETEALIGCFANTLALRTNLSNNPTFETLLQQVRTTALGAYAHQDLPFEQLVEALQPTRAVSHTPIFQVMLVLQNVPLPELDVEGIKWQVIDTDSGTSKFDITWVVSESPDGLNCKFEYSTDLFVEATIKRLAENLETLLQGIVENPQQNIGQLPILGVSEKQTSPPTPLLQGEGSMTGTFFPPSLLGKGVRGLGLHQLFETQVDQTPTRTAAISGTQNISYEELNIKANQLAHYLKRLGVNKEIPVGICVNRGLDMLVGILGILKAGGAYVPLDPNYPQQRLELIIQNAQIPVIVTQQQQLSKLPSLDIPVVCLDTDAQAIAQENTANLNSDVLPDNLAYIIYTSGTTGIPKGVAITHQSPVTLMYWAREFYSTAELTGVLASTSICFDLSVFEIFVSLSWGGTVILADNALQLPELPAKDQVTLLNTVPSAARELVRLEGIPASVTVVNLAGEPLPQSLVELLYQQSTINKVINLYGPSEDTTYSTVAVIPTSPPTPLLQGEGSMTSTSFPPSSFPPSLLGKGVRGLGSNTPTIGRPITNTQVYILDKYLQQVPIGVSGELYIAGAGLARGYWRQPDITAEKFIPNPFVNGRLYKTGDRARFLADGNIEYLGRLDFQVKLRGFRIELGEVETVLNQHPKVAQAVATIQENISLSEHARLVAYVVPKSSLEESELRQFLASKLPSYMLPSIIVMLETLPLTTNGKIDRRALPIPQLAPTTTASIAPRTPVEQQLTEVWRQILGVDVGIYDNFFSLGGDSILAIQVVAKANQLGLTLFPRQMFQYQTVAELAAVVDTSVKTLHVTSLLVTGDVPLTPIQHWFFEENLVEPHHWNQALFLEVQQPLNFTWLQQAFEQLIIHHDALRSRFERTEDGWRQTVEDNVSPYIINVDMSELKLEVSTALTSVANELQKSFDLAQPPLLRVAYFNLGGHDRLLIILHHLIIDGVSWRLLLEDLQLVYQQLSQAQEIKLPPKTTSFQEWAIKLEEYSHSQNIKQTLNYWTSNSNLSRGCQVKPLPTDFPQGRNTIANMDVYSVYLGSQDTENLLQNVSIAYQTQINDVLLTALALTFRSWTGAPLLLELEAHGRENLFPNVNLSRTIGWFTSLFPVLLDIGASTELGTCLKAIKEQLRQVPEYGISYGLLRYLTFEAIKVQLQAFPLPQVRFNYLGQSRQLFSESLFAPARESTGHNRSLEGNRNTLIEINSIVTGGELRLDWLYSQAIHERQTIVTLADNYLIQLRALIQHCLNPDAVGFTPSDFPQMDFSQDELDKLLADL